MCTDGSSSHLGGGGVEADTPFADTSSPCGQTDACESITFPATRSVKMWTFQRKKNLYFLPFAACNSPIFLNNLDLIASETFGVLRTVH